MYLYELLEDRPVDLVLAHPLKTKAIASARIKTDKIDATTLAQLLRGKLLPPAYLPPRPIRDLRELLRYRASLVVLRSLLKNKLQAVLLKHGLTCPWRNVLAKRAQPWWRAVPLRPCYQHAIAGYLAVAATVEAQLATTTQTVAARAAADPQAQLLQTVPGIGPYAALLILSEIGEITRFASPKHLVSYSGLCPATYASGATVRHGRLTKEGSPWLRWALIEAAIHVWHTPHTRLARLAQRLTRPGCQDCSRGGGPGTLYRHLPHAAQAGSVSGLEQPPVGYGRGDDPE
jgi:transposase